VIIEKGVLVDTLVLRNKHGHFDFHAKRELIGQKVALSIFHKYNLHVSHVNVKVLGPNAADLLRHTSGMRLPNGVMNRDAPEIHLDILLFLKPRLQIQIRVFDDNV